MSCLAWVFSDSATTIHKYTAKIDYLKYSNFSTWSPLSAFVFIFPFVSVWARILLLIAFIPLYVCLCPPSVTTLFLDENFTGAVIHRGTYGLFSIWLLGNHIGQFAVDAGCYAKGNGSGKPRENGRVNHMGRDFSFRWELEDLCYSWCNARVHSNCI